MGYEAKDLIERDCRDFRGMNKKDFTHCCEFSPTCKFKDQYMFADVIDGISWCLGIRDEKFARSVLVKEACKDRGIKKAESDNHML